MADLLSKQRKCHNVLLTPSIKMISSRTSLKKSILRYACEVVLYHAYLLLFICILALPLKEYCCRNIYKGSELNVLMVMQLCELYIESS